MQNRIEVIALDPRFKKLIPRTRRFLGRFFRLSHVENRAVEIYFVGDAIMKKNVLAYPADQKFPRPDLLKWKKPLGEVYVNPRYIERHGEELSSMILHGILHLSGYSHDRKRDRITMERRERSLLKRLHQL